MMAFAMFDTKAKRMRIAIEAMESAVEEKRGEVIDAEARLRAKLVQPECEKERPPPAGALAWRGRGNAD
jgi:hypothetical protein